MLTLSVIEANQAGASVVTWLGVVVFAPVAAIVIGLWVFVVRRLGQRDRDLALSRDEEQDLEALSQTQLVVQRGGKSRGPQAVVVSELEHTGRAGPTTP